ncbi:MAG: hypothetical protein QGG40_08480 [Myxococcota bacterium]|jgi:hypothetical protein|nr:hypothetical protein [Myxococcota bacterium]
MLLRLTSLVAVSAIASQPALADDFAQYTVGVGVSPFGGSVHGAYNSSPETTIFVALGGLPTSEAPFSPEIDGKEYTVTAGSSWVGCFVNHRPLENAEWFRVNVGIGIGSIQNELEDSDGNVYKADYNENPVGYVGVGVGGRAVQGFNLGFDMGWLQTAGPDIHMVEGSGENASDAIGDNMMFGSVLPNLQLTLNWGF